MLRPRTLAWTAVLALTVMPSAVADEESVLDVGKGVTFAKGDNSLTIGARFQARGVWDDREEFDGDVDPDPGDGIDLAGDGKEDGLNGGFDVARMRVVLKGGFWKPWLKYEFQFDMARTSGDSASKVKDAVLEIHRSPWAVWKFGQFKAPFSLQQMISSGRQQFVDRAITDVKFVPARDTGVGVGGLAESKRWGYAAGVFSGSGESRVQDDENYLYVGRVWLDPLGEYKLTESSLDDLERPVVHLGLAARTGEAIRGGDLGSLAAAGYTLVEDPNDETCYQAEVAFRSARFAASGEYFEMSNERRNPEPAQSDVDSNGFYVQAGVMAVPRTVEVALRWAEVEPDESASDAGLTEARLVFGYFFQGHNLKVQADAGEVVFGRSFASLPSVARRGLPALGPRLVSGEELTDRQYRIQLQLAF